MNSAPTQPETVEHDRNCIRCSYNLRGLAVDAVCPECALPVRDSLRGNLLQFAAPEYLATIHRGVRLILIGIPLKLLLPLALVFWFSATGRAASVLMALQGANLAAAAIIIWGYWRYTEPDPGFVGTETAGSARAVARILAVLSAVVIAIQVGVQWLGLMPIGAVAARIAFSVANSATLAGQYFAVMRYSQWLARRIPDSELVRRAGVRAWLLAGLELVSIVSAFLPLFSRAITPGRAPILLIGLVPLGLCPLAALILYWNLLDRVRKQLRSIRFTGGQAFPRARNRLRRSPMKTS